MEYDDKLCRDMLSVAGFAEDGNVMTLDCGVATISLYELSDCFWRVTVMNNECRFEGRVGTVGRFREILHVCGLFGLADAWTVKTKLAGIEANDIQSLSYKELAELFIKIRLELDRREKINK